MENIIAKLLQDFEQGKMTRRQLIQSVTLAASAAAAGVGTASLVEVPTAKAAGPVLKAINVDHISFDVHDYTKFRDFYSDLFGMEVFGDRTKPDRPPQCHLRCGDTYLTPRDRPAGTPTPRVQHIAIGIENFDKKLVEEALKSRGIPVKMSKTPGPEGDNCEIHDPEGFTIQIVRKGYEAT